MLLPFWNKFTRPVVGIIQSMVWQGQPLPGVDQGVKAIIQSGLEIGIKDLGYRCYLDGQINDDGSFDLKQDSKFPQPNFKNGILLGQLNQKIYEKAVNISSKNDFLLNIGGDHSVALGSITGLLDIYGSDLRVVWVDAHADCIQPDLSKYQYYHGMPVSSLFGWIPRNIQGFQWIQKNLKPENLVYIALRHVDEDERRIIKNFNITSYSMMDVIDLGIGEVMRRITEKYKGKPIHLSFDIDAVDPIYAPATGTKARNGLSSREAQFLAYKLFQSQQLVGMDMVEVNPSLELNQTPRQDLFGDEFQLTQSIKGTQTVALASEIILSALGRGTM